MRGVISAPKGIITGAFNIRIAFLRDVELTAEDVRVEPLEGDGLGHTKDSFSGSGKDYYILCYLPDERKGKSRISVVKEGLDVSPVIVEYDTVHRVYATWGTPIQRNAKIELPITFDVPLEHLRKRHFRFSRAVSFQLYGADAAYSLVFADSGRDVSVTVSGAVRKKSGVRAEIQPSIFNKEA